MVDSVLCSVHDRFCLKPFCSSAYKPFSSKYFTSLLFSTHMYNLYTVDSKAIPLYCYGSLGSIIEFLGMGLIIALFQADGITCMTKILLNMHLSNSQDALFFKNSFGKLSKPTALLSTFCISSNDILALKVSVFTFKPISSSLLSIYCKIIEIFIKFILLITLKQLVIVMVAEWVKAPAVWCDPWPGQCTGVVGSYPTGGMAGLRTLVKPLINCTIIQLYSCQN